MNKKTITRIFGIALVLVMLVSSLSAFAVGSSAAGITESALTDSIILGNPASKITTTKGLTFDDFTGALVSGTDYSTNTTAVVYLRDKAGVFFTPHKDAAQHGAVTIKKQGSGDYAINLAGSTFFINGNAGDKKDQALYDKNSLWLDLLNDTTFAKKFSVSMDLTVNGESGKTDAITKTSDNGAGARLATSYRGSSAITVNGTWLFKITSANIPAYKQGEKAPNGGYYAIIEDETIPADMVDKGYIYPNSGVANLASTGSDTLAKYSRLNDGTWETDGRTGACISEEMMDRDGVGDALTYTLNKPFTVKFDVTKGTDGKATVDVYIDGTKLWQTKYTMGGDNQWKYGIRLFDASCNIDVDNVVIDLDEENIGDIHTGAWRDVSRSIACVDGNENGMIITEICNRCGVKLSKTYPNVVYDGVDSVGIVVDSVTADGGYDSIPGVDENGRTYHADISGAWSTIKTAPYALNFTLANVTRVKGADDGKSLLTWRQNGTGFAPRMLRLHSDGSLRLEGNQGITAINSDFRLKGTTANPGNYNFHIIVDPTTGRYDVYIDDLNDTAPMFYFGTEYNYNLTALGGSAPSLRFGDSAVGTMRIENFSITHNVAAENHDHTSAYTDASNKGVIVGYDTLNPALNCYCGEPIPQGDVNEVLVKTDNVYYGRAAISVPTEGEFWIATDVNIRSKAALEEIGNNAIINIGNFSVNGAALSAPATYQYAVKVSYVSDTTADVEVYIDGKIDSSYKGVVLSDDLNLGCTDSTDVRFNYTKIVKLGTGEAVPVTYNDAVNTELVPCYHSVKSGTAKFTTIAGESYATGNVKALKKLVYSYDCSKCGEKVVIEQGDVLKLNENVDSSLPVDSSASVTTALPGGGKGIYTEMSEMYDNADPYWLSFDLKAEFTEAQIAAVKAKGSNGASLLALRIPMVDISAKQSGDPRYANIDDKYFWGGGANDTFAYVHFMRLFAAPGRDDTLAFNFYMGGSGNPKVVLEQGRTYKIAIWVDVTPEYVHYKAYLDGVLVEERFDNNTSALIALQGDRGDLDLLATKKSSRYPNFRFTDQGTNWGNFFVSNIALVKAADENHVHTDKWSAADEKSVVLTEKVLEQYYTCYCGEKILAGQINEIVYDGIENVYELDEQRFNLPEGEFWIAADYNIRSADAVNPSASIGIGEGNIFNGLVIINQDKELWGCEKIFDVEGPATYSIAIRVIDRTAYELYVDGKLVGMYKGVELTGNEILISTNDARFNNIKIVKLGDTETPLVPTYSVDESVRPCMHQPEGGFLANVVRDENGNLTYTFLCSECGERVNNAPVVDSFDEGSGLPLDATGSWSYSAGGSNTKLYALPADFVGADKAPYQLEFTLRFDANVDFDIIANYNAETGAMAGRNIVNSHNSPKSNGVYNALVRHFPVIDENGNFDPDKIAIKSKNSADAIPLTVLAKGESAVISLYVDPAKSTVDIYVDGEYKCTRGTDGYNPTYPEFRFNDGAGAKFTVSDFKLMRAGEDDSHEHTDRYLNKEESAATTFTVLDDNKIVYTYPCYCGETVTKGISEVVLEEVAPLYGISDAYKFEFFGDAFVTNFAVRTLPDQYAVIARLGGWEIIVDNNGKIFSGGVETDVVIAADSQYHTLAFLANPAEDDVYFVYIDGKLVSEAILGSLNRVELGATSGVYHFDRIAVVNLSEEGDIAFVTDDSHVHTFDPYTAELTFNSDRSTITIDYVCVECDRPAVDGIVKNLTDDEATEDVQEVIIPSLGNTEPGALVLVDNILAAEKAAWISADIAVIKAPARELPLITFGGNTILTIDKGGVVRVGGEKIGQLDSKFVNVTFNVCVEGEGLAYYIYVDGKFVATVYSDFIEDDVTVVLGNEETVIDYKNAKFVEMGNDGSLVIGAYDCGADNHDFDYKKATVKYIDRSSFEYVYTCRYCGLTITEKAAYSYYEGAITDVYEFGGIVEPQNPLNGESDCYWVVADVVARGDRIGAFIGYKNLIGEHGKSIVLVNNTGDLMLGDGTKLKNDMVTKMTMNFAIRATLDGVYYVYIDGKYAGKTTGELVYDCEYLDGSYETFGNEYLDDVKFYNIKSIETAPTDAPIALEYATNKAIVPCYHNYDVNLGLPRQVVFGNTISTVYICSICGERVYDEANINAFEQNINKEFVFDEKGELTFTTYRHLYGTTETMGPTATPYWLSFNLRVNSLDVDEIVKGGGNAYNPNSGRNLLNFGQTYDSPLRMFAIADGNGGYLPGRVEVKDHNYSSAKTLFTMIEGEDYDITLYVNPKSKNVDIYLDGELVSTRTAATHASQLYVRILDGAWGNFTISNFSFVKTPSHVHTSEYSTILGGEDILVYGETTLNHRYTCYCGEVINEGISKIYLDGIQDLKDITAAASLGTIEMDSKNYWISAKVYSGNQDCNVYTYDGEYLVDISGGVYRVGNVATDVVPSADYDVVSVKVLPAEDRYLVYINGKFVGEGANIDFTPGENFNVKLGGGGVATTFTNIKLVALENGANGFVIGCGDHRFAYNGGVIAEATGTGIVYKCKGCGTVIRTVTPADGNGHYHMKGESGLSGNKNYKLTDYYSTIFSKNLGKNFYLSYEMTFTTFSNHNKDSGGRSLLTWIHINDGTASYEERFLRLYYISDNKAEMKIRDKDGSYLSLGELGIVEAGKTYKFMFEVNPVTGQYYAYVNGQYAGTATRTFDWGDPTAEGANIQYEIRFADSVTCKYDVANFDIYTTKSVVDSGADSDTTAVHVHKVDTEKASTLKVVDGKLVHSFTCSGCGKAVTLTNNTNLLPEGTKTDYTTVTRGATMPVGTAMSKGAAPYWLSLDFTANFIDVGAITQANLSNGRSFLSIEGAGDNRIHLLRGYAVPTADGKGYEEGILELRCCTSKKSPLVARVRSGETVNISFYVVPDTLDIYVYVNGEYVAKHGTGGCGCSAFNDNFAGELTLRMTENHYGNYDYTNIKLNALTDACLHENAESCVNGASYICECGLEVAAAHNYRYTYDLTGKWAVYECVDCGAFHVEFVDTEIIAELDITDKNKLSAYLAATYPIMFVR